MGLFPCLTSRVLAMMSFADTPLTPQTGLSAQSAREEEGDTPQIDQEIDQEIDQAPLGETSTDPNNDPLGIRDTQPLPIIAKSVWARLGRRGKRLFSPEKPTALLIIPTSGSTLDRTALETMMQGLALPVHRSWLRRFGWQHLSWRPDNQQSLFAFELAGSAESQAFLVRAAHPSLLAHLAMQLQSRFTTATILPIPVARDPLALRTGEEVSVYELRRGGAESYLPIRVSEHHNAASGQGKFEPSGLDPLVSLLATLSALPRETRVVYQLAVSAAPEGWSLGHDQSADQYSLYQARDDTHQDQQETLREEQKIERQKELGQREANTASSAVGIPLPVIVLALLVVAVIALWHSATSGKRPSWIPASIWQAWTGLVHHFSGASPSGSNTGSSTAGTASNTPSVSSTPGALPHTSFPSVPHFSLPSPSHVTNYLPLLLAIVGAVILLAIIVRVLRALFSSMFLGNRWDRTHGQGKGLLYFLKLKRHAPIYDTTLVSQKTQRVAYHSVLRLYAISPGGGNDPAKRQAWRDWREQILDQATAAYRQFHTANAGFFRAHHLWGWQARHLLPEFLLVSPDLVEQKSRGITGWGINGHNHGSTGDSPLAVMVASGSRSGWSKGVARSNHLLTVAEIATIWHLPSESDLIQFPFLQDIATWRARLAPRAVATFEAPLGLQGPQDGSEMISVRYTPQEERLLERLAPLPSTATAVALQKVLAQGNGKALNGRILPALLPTSSPQLSATAPSEGSAVQGESGPLPTGDEITLPSISHLTPQQLVLGYSLHGAQRAEVKLTPDLLGRHTFAIGGTGSGKSTLLQALARSWLQIDVAPEPTPGMVLIDPHGDLASAILQTVPANRLEDVLLLDLADVEFPFALNPLDVGLGRGRDEACEALIAIFAHIWEDSWGHRMEDIWTSSLKTLFEANEYLVAHDPVGGYDQQYTLVDVPALLTTPAFLRMVLSQVSDREIIEWWTRFSKLDKRFRLEIVQPVLNKVGKFGGSKVARRILGQGRSSIDLVKALSMGQVIIVKLAENIVGPDTSSLTGATILGLTQMAIGGQQHLRLEQRRRTQVIIDEFQAIPGANYAAMLAELRKFGGVFVLATQSLSHLDRLGPTLRASVLSNISNLFAAHMSADDADKIAAELDGSITPQDLKNLADFTFYARLIDSGQRLRTFSFMMVRPPRGSLDQEEELRQISRELVGRPAEEVEESILQAQNRRLMRSGQDGDSDDEDDGASMGDSDEDTGQVSMRQSRGNQRNPQNGGNSMRGAGSRRRSTAAQRQRQPNTLAAKGKQSDDAAEPQENGTESEANDGQNGHNWQHVAIDTDGG